MTRKSLTRRRHGYTLMELLVATASATVLMAGLSSSIYVASQALQIDNGTLAAEARNGRALERLLADAREAFDFSEQTATAITFTVPDRNGDDSPETIRYAWSGSSGAPLTYEINGSASANLIEDVRQLDFGFVTRIIDRSEDSANASTASVYYEGMLESDTEAEVESVDLETPAGVLEGHLLIAAVAIDGEHADTLAPPPGGGWDSGPNSPLVLTDYSNDITFGVWWKLASASEPATHSFTWSGSECVYGWMMHFTGHDQANPIHAYLAAEDDFKFPAAESVTTTVDRCLVLRLGGFNEDDINNNDTGMVDHQRITMRARGSSGGTAVSGGAAYATQDVAGSTGVGEFELTHMREYITLTIAIAPDPNG